MRHTSSVCRVAALVLIAISPSIAVGDTLAARVSAPQEVDVLDHERDSGLVTYGSDGDWTAMNSESGDALAFEIDGDSLIYRRGDLEVPLEREFHHSSALASRNE